MLNIPCLNKYPSLLEIGHLFSLHYWRLVYSHWYSRLIQRSILSLVYPVDCACKPSLRRFHPMNQPTDNDRKDNYNMLTIADYVLRQQSLHTMSFWRCYISSCKPNFLRKSRNKIHPWYTLYQESCLRNIISYALCANSSEGSTWTQKGNVIYGKSKSLALHTSFRAVDAGIRASSNVRCPAEAPPYLLTAATPDSNANDPEGDKQGIIKPFTSPDSETMLVLADKNWGHYWTSLFPWPHASCAFSWFKGKRIAKSYMSPASLVDVIWNTRNRRTQAISLNSSMVSRQTTSRS